MTIERSPVPPAAGHVWDVVVVGAGLAGLRAARDCADAGLDVLVVEAQDRVGGRGFTSGADVLGVDVELGGTWIAPGQTEVWKELSRYGLESRDYQAPTEVRWRTGGVLRRGMPVAMQHWAALEHALATIHADALLDPVPDSMAMLSCQAYFDRLDVPAEVVDVLNGWAVMMSGSDLAEVAVTDLLDVVMRQGGVVGLLTALASSPLPGWGELARRMAEGSTAQVWLTAPVHGVAPASDGLVDVTLVDGTVASARHVIVAVPVNVLPSLALDTVLAPRISGAAGRNVGRVAKVWMLVDGVPLGALASGRGLGLDWLYAPLEHDGHTLILGFGLPGPQFRPEVRADVERALHAFFPEATLLAFHHHDWVQDPWARGTYVSAPAGAQHVFGDQAWPGVGPVEFVGSDLAPDHAGWFEGALLSGRDAAARIVASRRPVDPVQLAERGVQ